ncbi:MAG: M28 family peptidase [Deltaproteobacteria bacterium]|nr:M28 family peptidase [Deltaproteobacteria bacterium]
MAKSPTRLTGRILTALALAIVATNCWRHSKSSKSSPEPSPAYYSSSSFVLDDALAKSDLSELSASPHPMGSERQRAIAAWLTQRLKSVGIDSISDEFKAVIPNPAALASNAGPVDLTLERAGINIYTTPIGNRDASCVIALATHFDTKSLEGIAYLGANDSGSSTAVLLQLLAFIKKSNDFGRMKCAVVGWFFDGEEAVLKDWNDGQVVHPAKIIDHTYGSRNLASKLVDCGSEGAPPMCIPRALAPMNSTNPGRPNGPLLLGLILLDMVGSPDIKLTRTTSTLAELQGEAERGAKELGFPLLWDSQSLDLENDHTPFFEMGIPTIDLIDFKHLDHWHKDSDTPDRIATSSLNIAGRLALYLVSVFGTEGS